MKPRIFPANTTDFSTVGYGTLDCVYCTVTEERNGIFELELKLHHETRHFEHVIEGNIIGATHSNKRDIQPFQIYKVTRTIDGFATVYAEHISYQLNKNVIMPFSASGIVAALQSIPSHTADPCGFTFRTDMNSDVVYKLETPRTVKAMMIGEEGSIVDVFGTGEYEYDKFTVWLRKQRGEDNGVVIRYGKNMTDIIKETDISDIYTAIVPYWCGTNDEEEEITVTLTEKLIQSEYVDLFPTKRTVSVDFSSDFEDEPTQAQLRSAAQSYINNNVRRQLLTSIKTEFIDLSITDEYKNKADLMSVNLCDYVTVIYKELGVRDKQEVVKVVYDVLLERNKSVELGDLKKTLANAMRAREAGVRSLIDRSTENTKKELTKNINNTKETLLKEINESKEDCEEELERLKQELQQQIDELKNQDPTDMIYPVGSIYLTVGTENPATLFGGTWKMIETGRFLRSAAVGNAENKGGSTRHSHTYKWDTETMMRISSNGTNGQGASFAGYPVIFSSKPDAATIETETDYNSMLGTVYIDFEQSAMSYYIDRTNMTGQKIVARTEEADVTPYYMDVYMWQRTA